MPANLIPSSFDRLRFSALFVFLVCFVLPWGLCPSVGFAVEREIVWTEDYEGAVQRAAASNSILLLHFYGDYCPPCKLLDKKTFKDPALIAAINSTVVPVKVNADRRRDLAQKYNVNRWPTDVYLFPNGDELYRGVSDQDPTVYAQKIKRLALRHRDWTLEREAIAKTTQRRQDKELAANTPQIQTQRPVYAGSAGLPVKSQAASWQQPSGLPLPAAPLPEPSSVAVKPQRLIDNPFVSKQPIMVPASPQKTEAPATEPASVPKVSEPVAPVVERRTIPALPTSGDLVRSNSPGSNSRVTAPEQPEPTHIVADTIGLEGHCPVELIESLSRGGNPSWVRGVPAYAVRHRGRVYHCSSEQARQTLLTAPDRFTPCLSCFDLVNFVETGELIDGKCEFGCIQPETNRVFLFATKENLEAFDRDNHRYAQLIDNVSPERVAGRADETRIR